jgi:hypothetical protein
MVLALKEPAIQGGEETLTTHCNGEVLGARGGPELVLGWGRMRISNILPEQVVDGPRGALTKQAW